MLNKIQISGEITVETGMHIGASDAFAAIGAIDSPVVRDAISQLPYIPGSTLKGKMRCLLGKAYNSGPVNNRDDDDARIVRLFGASKDKNNSNHPVNSRLIFSDSIMSNMEELENLGLQNPTEAKEENTINPLTAVANPRQIERVVRGAKFPLDLIYNVTDEATILEDFETIAQGLKLLQYDYIGGHGSRGYGKIEIGGLKLKCVVGNVNQNLLDKCGEIVKEA